MHSGTVELADCRRCVLFLHSPNRPALRDCMDVTLLPFNAPLAVMAKAFPHSAAAALSAAPIKPAACPHSSWSVLDPGAALASSDGALTYWARCLLSYAFREADSDCDGRLDSAEWAAFLVRRGGAGSGSWCGL